MPVEWFRHAFADRLHAVRSTSPRDALADIWERYYWLLAGVIVAAGLLAMGRPFVRRHGFTPPFPHNDTIILEYVGWFVANGHTLYTDIWEIKPPLAFFPPYLFALVTGTNMYLHHLLGIATTALAFALTAAFTARVIGTLTDSPVAGLAAGLAFFSMPDAFYLPWLGYQAKIVVYVFGMAALDRAVRDRHFTSGVLAGLAVGFWQLAIVFPVLTTIYAARTRSRAALRRHVAGGAVALLCLGVSLLLYADVGGFVAEVVLGPLVLESERGAFDPQTYLLFFQNDLGFWITLIGVCGLGLAGLDVDRFPAWPLALGGALVAGIIVFVDFDGALDMFFPLVFTALGVGIVVSYLPRRAGIAAVVLFALVVAPIFAPSEFIRQDPVEPEQTDGYPPALEGERAYVYWNHRPVESCRFFAGQTQRSVLEYRPDADRVTDVDCGDVGLYWNVTKHRVLSALPGPFGTSPSGPVTATPTPTPTPNISIEGFDYRTTNGTTVVTVVVLNGDDEQRTTTVVSEVETNGDTRTQCTEVTLDANAEETLRFRFEGVSPESPSPTIWINNEGKASAGCG